MIHLLIFTLLSKCELDFNKVVPSEEIFRVHTCCYSKNTTHILPPIDGLMQKRRSSNNRQTSDIRRTFVGNKIVDHSDVVGASPVGAASTTSSFSIWHLASMNWAKTIARRDEKHLSALWFGAACIRGLTVRLLFYAIDTSIHHLNCDFYRIWICMLFMNMYPWTLGYRRMLVFTI